MNWQPIETAPNEETILLYDGEKQFTGCRTLKVYEQFAPKRKTLNWYVWEYWPKPTHWMPLPPPPEEIK